MMDSMSTYQAVGQGQVKRAVPKTVQVSFALWIVAIVAGVLETTLVATGTAAGENVIVGVALRCAVFVGAVFTAMRMRAGKQWARAVLAVVLGIVGTLSLVVGPVMWLVDGHSLHAAIAGIDTRSALFAASRGVHLAAVLSAVVFMFRPAASAYFRATRALG
jgi:hypothetical protein